MNIEIIEEVERLGGDCTKPVWQWLLNNGPHGNSFTWSQTRSEPAGFLGVELLERLIDEKIESSLFSKEEAQVMVKQALQSNDINILVRAIQIGAVIGMEKEMEIICLLTKHENELVFKNAKASSYYLKKRLR